MKGSLVDWLLSLTPMQSPLYAMYSWLIHTTIYVTITALFIILFKQIFKNRLRAKWHFLIWAVLLIRFIVPVLPASPVSVFNTVKVDENVIEQSSYQSIVTTPDNESVNPDDENQYTVAQGSQKMIEAEQNIKDHNSETTSGYTIQIDAIVTYVWLGGTIFLLGYFITVLEIYRHKLKKSRREYDNLTLLNKCKEQLDIKRKVRVYYTDTTPMLIGLFKSSVYVPDGLSEAELEATLLHELNHMKHLDVLWSAIATVVLCLNWFNPIIWISFFMFKRDLEVYCDERTLMHTENKQSYAMLLLKTATARKEKFILGTTSMQSGKADVKRRIRYMAKYKKLKAVGTVLSVVLVSTLLVGCLTNAGVFTKKTSTIENPANSCKMDIVLDKSFVGDDYLTGDGTLFEFHTDKPIEEIADSALEALSAKNNTLPLLRKQYAQVQKGIDNLLNAMEQGIITASTKERMEALEQQKSELSVQILREEAAKPTLTKKEILFWFHRFRKLDTRKLEHRRRLIDSFINAVFLYDDRIAFAFNYKDGTKTITLEELENSALGSDLTALAAPHRYYDNDTICHRNLLVYLI